MMTQSMTMTSLCWLVLCMPSGVRAEVMVFAQGEEAAFDGAAAGFGLQVFGGDFSDGTARSPSAWGFSGFAVTESTGAADLHKALRFLHSRSEESSTATFLFDQPINALGVTTINFAREGRFPNSVAGWMAYLESSSDQAGDHPGVSQINISPDISQDDTMFSSVVNTAESLTRIWLTGSMRLGGIGSQ